MASDRPPGQKAGLLKTDVLAGKDIESMARLPSKEILRAQLVMTLNAPISGLVMALSQIIRKFVYCLDQIKEKKANEKSEQTKEEGGK